MRKIRNNLKDARESKRYSVEEMAERLQISESYYYKIEQGTRNPTLGLAQQIADILGESVERLFFNSRIGQNVYR